MGRAGRRDRKLVSSKLQFVATPRRMLADAGRLAARAAGDFRQQWRIALRVATTEGLAILSSRFVDAPAISLVGDVLDIEDAAVPRQLVGVLQRLLRLPHVLELQGWRKKDSGIKGYP